MNPSPATSKGKQLAGALGWGVLTFSAAAIGAAASVDASDFYQQLVRPSWAPPGWLFGPVWTVLYATMALAAWLVWRRGGFGSARGALVLFVAQLGVNALWSWLFFSWRLGAAALLDVVLLWCLLVATVLAFQRLSTAASLLLLPYLAWVTFAAALTFSVWRLNPELL